jgi:hypothetical protein
MPATLRSSANGSSFARFHPFAARLKDEAQDAPKVQLLLMPHQVRDVSADAVERKNGTDFFLTPALAGHEDSLIRVESKFEKRATGRIALELVSVDRPRLTPGWMFTSRTAWLMSWFPSGDVVVLPMQELRDYLLHSPARHQATTAWNQGYLSWNSLEDINWLVARLSDARVLDLRFELGGQYAEPSMLRGAALTKRCTADELVQLMASRPHESQPVVPSEAELVRVMQALKPRNRMRSEATHIQLIAQLPGAWGLGG